MTENYRQLSFMRLDAGEVNFIVDPKSGFNDSTLYETLNHYCDPAFLQEHATDVRFCGGRGQTMLFTLGPKDIGALYGPVRDFALEAAKAESSQHKLQTSFPLCLRFYRRGGLIGKVLKTGFVRWSPSARRARAEFVLTAGLYAEGFPVPRPLLAKECISGCFITNALVMEQLPHTQNLAEILEQRRALTPHEVILVAKTLARFFKAGVYHSDLNIRNILLAPAPAAEAAAEPAAKPAAAGAHQASSGAGAPGGKCYLIDFDKCSRGKLTLAQVEQMLARLERSFNKEKELKEYDESLLNVPALMTMIRAQVKAEVKNLPQGGLAGLSAHCAAWGAAVRAHAVTCKIKLFARRGPRALGYKRKK